MLRLPELLGFDMEEKFEVWSHCYHTMQTEVSARDAAPIMGVTIKTAQNYLSGKTKTDPVRLAHLRSVVGQKIIPQDVPLWWNPKKKTLCCNSDWAMGAAELINLYYLRELRERTIDQLNDKVTALKTEIETMKTRLQAAAAKPAMPSNVIQFPTFDRDRRA